MPDKASIKVTEIFYSVQGEGINAGVPSVFVRLFGCNLTCSWCDTKYAWHKDFARFDKRSAVQVAEQICVYGLSNNVVFTGGEPALLQPAIRKIRKELLVLSSDFSFEIETNGTLAITDSFWDVINISPKLENSGQKPYEILAQGWPQKSWWKFVVDHKADLTEILALMEKHNISHQRVMLMPQAQTRKQLVAASPKIIELCKQHGFRFSPRLQVFVYCDKAGV
ncbi:MAG: 7-carboxy-7-deazaguanine synthase QueE [Hyphomicrobiaceae bacterium]|nr:7-carboxy-7-deazaguanine synthase QueE [Hyphomicrobiaceae bacterium]